MHETGSNPIPSISLSMNEQTLNPSYVSNLFHKTSGPYQVSPVFIPRLQVSNFVYPSFVFLNSKALVSFKKNDTKDYCRIVLINSNI